MGTITLIVINTTSLIACYKTTLTLEELVKLKEKNKKIIDSNKLEWIAPQEKPFKNVDYKYYFVIWHINNGDDWRIIKFKNDKYLNPYKIEEKILDSYNNYSLKLKVQAWPDLLAHQNTFYNYWWELDDGSHFKSIYRWDGEGEPNTDFEYKLKNYLDL